MWTARVAIDENKSTDGRAPLAFPPASAARLTIPLWEYTLSAMARTIVEERDAVKAIDALPPHVAGKYTTWLSIVREQGPQGLRAIKGFHDEKLSGDLKGLRSSRLSQQWRVIYRVESHIVTLYVERITPHNYRK